ncbi:hypothetical protein F5B21DRAFT_214890 [Xylaria acuta]|nr:hypothetical protein F5B21DRAFT_214890 [Xylaria acuta]
MNFLGPIIDSTEAGSGDVLKDISNNMTIAKPFYQLMSENRDFKRATRYPDTDYLVLSAVPIRFLIRRIFEKGIFDKNKQPYQFLQLLENGVSNNPREGFRDITLQVLRHNTYKALLSTPYHSSMTF